MPVRKFRNPSILSAPIVTESVESAACKRNSPSCFSSPPETCTICPWISNSVPGVKCRIKLFIPFRFNTSSPCWGTVVLSIPNVQVESDVPKKKISSSARFHVRHYSLSLRRDSPLIYKQTPLDPLLSPFPTEVFVQDHIARRIEDGPDGRVAPL
jgi:hypothetical protein